MYSFQFESKGYVIYVLLGKVDLYFLKNLLYSPSFFYVLYLNCVVANKNVSCILSLHCNTSTDVECCIKMHSSFPIIHNVGNIGIVVLLKFENTLYGELIQFLIQSTMTNVSFLQNSLGS